MPLENVLLGGKMKRETIATNQAFVSKSPLAQAVKVGNMLFVSGQVPVDSNTMRVVSEDFPTQAKHVLESLKAVVQAAGASLRAVVKTTVFLTDMSRFQEMNGIYREYFLEEPPARTCIGVKELPRNSQIEMEAIAVLDTEDRSDPP
jgi:2-iminobutanoate/2-iminopropanoate deaminase